MQVGNSTLALLVALASVISVSANEIIRHFSKGFSQIEIAFTGPSNLWMANGGPTQEGSEFTYYLYAVNHGDVPGVLIGLESSQTPSGFTAACLVDDKGIVVEPNEPQSLSCSISSDQPISIEATDFLKFTCNFYATILNERGEITVRKVSSFPKADCSSTVF